MGWTAREYDRMEKLCSSQDEVITKLKMALQYIIEIGDHHEDCKNCRDMRFIAKKELERLYESYNCCEDDLVAERAGDY